MSQRVSADDISVWTYKLGDIHLNDMAPFLSHKERLRAGTYRYREDRTRYVKSHGMARVVLGVVANEPPAEINIGSRSGKPYLAHHPQHCFSLSCSEDYFVIGVANTAMGIDVEKINTQQPYEQVAQCFLHAEERQAINRLPSVARAEAFLQVWTQKEALAKALGKGVHFDFERFAVPIEGGAVFFENDVTPSCDWYSAIMKTVPGYTLAVASSRPSARIRFVTDATCHIPKTVFSRTERHSALHTV